MRRARKGAPKKVSKQPSSIDVISQDKIHENVLPYINNPDDIQSLINSLFPGQSIIRNIEDGAQLSLKTEQDLDKINKDLRKILTSIVYSIEPNEIFTLATKRSANEKLLIIDSFHYALDNYSTMSEEEIVSFVNKFDNSPIENATDTFVFKACSQIIECCKSGAIDKVDKLLNYLTNNIVTNGVDVRSLGYLSKVEEIKKSDHDSAKELEGETIEIKILRDSKIYKNEQRREEAKSSDQDTVVRFAPSPRLESPNSRSSTPLTDIVRQEQGQEQKKKLGGGR